MGSYKVECIIYADCLTSFSKEDIQLLSQNLEQYEYKEQVQYGYPADKKFNTFCSFLSHKPYEILLKEYTIPNDGRNKHEAENSLGLDEYLTIEEIKQLNFYEYGDNIHRIHIQEKSNESYTYCSAKDLLLVSKKLKEYLLNTEEQKLKLDKKYAEELQKLELLATVGSKYNADCLLIHGIF